MTRPSHELEIEAFSRNKVLAVELRQHVERANAIIDQLRQDKDVKVVCGVYTNCGNTSYMLDVKQGL